MWISLYIHYEVWDEITWLFPNFNGSIIWNGKVVMLMKLSPLVAPELVKTTTDTQPGSLVHKNMKYKTKKRVLSKHNFFKTTNIYIYIYMTFYFISLTHTNNKHIYSAKLLILREPHYTWHVNDHIIFSGSMLLTAAICLIELKIFTP